MPVIEYSLKKQGNLQLSANFVVREFACKDGSDTILIDSALVTLCQRIRDYFAVPVTIRSGYRTAAYNKAIGGANDSYHMKGRAADIAVAGQDPILVALFAQNGAGIRGIGLYSYPQPSSGFAHIDTRDGRWRGVQTKSNGGGESLLGDYFPVLKKGSKGNTVVLVQRLLKLTDDGIFGSATELAVKKFQAANNLVSDGICGAKTWAALVTMLKSNDSA